MKAMLALGRGIITKTTALNDSIMQKVTGFLPKWSDLQINWQNWTDEILDGIEKCRHMDNELDAFRTKVDIIKAACTKLLPTAVSVDSLDTQLQHLQVCTHLKYLFCCYYSALQLILLILKELFTA